MMPGERGPKGDHGQMGDEGQAGIAGPEGREGVQGITGERGKIGDTGEAGKRGHRGPAFAGPLAWIVLVVVITLVLLVFGYLIRQNSKAREALCVIRKQHAHEVVQSNELLEQFKGETIFGIPRALIENSRDEDQRTVDALKNLDCPPLAIQP